MIVMVYLNVKLKEQLTEGDLKLVEGKVKLAEAKVKPRATSEERRRPFSLAG